MRKLGQVGNLPGLSCKGSRRPRRESPMSQTIRTFLAIDISGAARDRVESVVRTLRARPNGDRVRWTSPENLHVTLRFLGDVKAIVLPDLVGAVAEELRGHPAFPCELKEVRAFPNARSPRVIAVALVAEGHLTELAAAVERGAVRSGFPRESHSFRAHLTLGRLRGHAYPSVHGDFDLSGFPTPVDSVVLFQSELKPEGAVYSEIERIPLETAGEMRA